MSRLSIEEIDLLLEAITALKSKGYLGAGREKLANDLGDKLRWGRNRTRKRVATNAYMKAQKIMNRG